MNLYKYMSEKRIEDILVKNKIRFTQPIYFNDPFEIKLSISGFAENQMLDDIFESNYKIVIQEEYEKLDSKLKNKLDFNTFLSLANSKKQETKKMHLNLVENINNHKILKKKFDEIINKIIGVLSLTVKYDNLLMWAHYANEHKGFVVEFDIKNDFFKPIEIGNNIYNGVQRVNYSSRRPNKLLVDNKWKDILLTKSIEWEYEDEFRIIKRLEEADEIKNDIYLFRFPKKMIKAIYCGCNMSVDEEINIFKILDNDRELSHVKIYKARVSEQYYKLEFRQIR